ncbi:hypothetical protein F4678DRAFT_484731 [Xylaria arbuscula]|nr:hypothetical protein F4678DRAFT_484731 [Xylaria arbuscula]
MSISIPGLRGIMSPFTLQQENEEQARLIGDGSTATFRSAQTSYYRKRYHQLRVVVVLLTLAVAGLGSAFAVVASRKQSAKEHDSQPMWMPPRNRVNKVFWPKDQFAIDPDDESEKAWDSLFPVGGGFVDLANDASFLSDAVGSERRAVVSVFHQLHCLVTSSLPQATRAMWNRDLDILVTAGIISSRPLHAAAIELWSSCTKATLVVVDGVMSISVMTSRPFLRGSKTEKRSTILELLPLLLMIRDMAKVMGAECPRF